jgi:prevent-host-death family protein
VKVASEAEVAAAFSDYVKAAKKEPVVVTNKGQPIAVLFGTEDEDDLERLLMGHSSKLQSILEAARKRFRKGRGIPHEAFWKEVEVEHATSVPKRKRSRTRRSG